MPNVASATATTRAMPRNRSSGLFMATRRACF
jgi:hypothetical protein